MTDVLDTLVFEIGGDLSDRTGTGPVSGAAACDHPAHPRRYLQLGKSGLCDRSRRAHHCPHATSEEVVGKIVHLRQNYHFGPLKIAMYLKRYHQITISTSGVWRILKRLDLNLPPSCRATKSKST